MHTYASQERFLVVGHKPCSKLQCFLYSSQVFAFPGSQWLALLQPETFTGGHIHSTGTKIDTAVAGSPHHSYRLLPKDSFRNLMNKWQAASDIEGHFFLKLPLA